MRVKLVGETLAEVFTHQLPRRLIGDKAYDSDPLDAEPAEQGVEILRRINEIGKKQPRRTVENCVVTSGDGRLNDCLRGFINFVESLFVTIITPRIFLVLST